MNTQARKSTDDDVEVDDEDDDQFELEIVDDTPEEDRPFKKAKADADDDDTQGEDDDDDDEVGQYSERVQKRIKKLKYEFHEERRAKEEAKRIEQEAINYAQQTQQEIDRLRKQLNDGQGYLYKEAEGRLDAQMAAARRDLKDAYDIGDSDKIVEAQSKLADLAAEKSRLSGYRPRPQSSREQNVQHAQPQPQGDPSTQHIRQPSDMGKRWAEKNTWFNRDPKMTAYAFGVHEDLIRNKGVQPDTENYYRQIDKEMRKMFPSEFGIETSDDGNAPASVVAAPSRKAPRKPRTVRLTATQVALAKRLGISPEQYAAQVMKDKGNG